MPAETESLESLLARAAAEIAAADSLPELTRVRAAYLGRKGSVAALLRGLGELAEPERLRQGKLANQAKERIEQAVSERRAALETQARERALGSNKLDPTLPGAAPPAGGLHPITRVMRDMVGFFSSLGFGIEKAEVVPSTQLRSAQHRRRHPARERAGHPYVEGGRLLRTHTSTVQIGP